MVKLDEIKTWEKLNSPSVNSGKIPALIKELNIAYSSQILDELCWECIYHQNSLYEVTFAAVPYLIDFCESTNNKGHKLDLFLNLGVILCELDRNENLLYDTFKNSKYDKETIKDIIETFKISFEKLKSIATSLFDFIIEKEEIKKRYFLASLAVAHKNFKMAKVFSVYSENEEYICNCPKCNEEFYLWNVEEKLILYTDDPVFNKNQEEFLIQEKLQENIKSSHIITENNNLEWLTFYIEKFNIFSLKSIVNYLFGEIDCPKCKSRFEVFDAISQQFT